jgi:hypothetical protein
VSELAAPEPREVQPQDAEAVEHIRELVVELSADLVAQVSISTGPVPGGDQPADGGHPETP